MKLDLTPEEKDALKASLAPPQNGDNLTNKERQQNTWKNLFGFCLAFILTIAFGYLLVVIASKLM